MTDEQAPQQPNFLPTYDGETVVSDGTKWIAKNGEWKIYVDNTPMPPNCLPKNNGQTAISDGWGWIAKNGDWVATGSVA